MTHWVYTLSFIEKNAVNMNGPLLALSDSTLFE